MGWFGRKSIIEPRMVRIRPGAFVMGASTGDRGSGNDERPQHNVRIDHAFEVAKYPVTFTEWDAAAALGASQGYRPSDHRWGRGMRPVINVSWDHAQDYIRFLNERTGKTYRLLSEAEWEYCCRAGTTTAYSFGDTITRKQANFKYWQTVPVTRFPANQFGLVGMHGNVWEWCEDCWHGSYHDAPTDGRPWMRENSGDCGRAVVRGGSAGELQEGLRSANRGDGSRSGRGHYGGFRLARTLPR